MVSTLLTSGCNSSHLRQARVSITKAPEYGQSVYATVREILAAHKVAIRGKRIVVKPNLVEFETASCINSHPQVVHAVFEAARSLGASDVKIAEGPGHRRGTLDLADAAGYFDTVPGFEQNFVDLNLDSVTLVKLKSPASKLKELYLPNTVLAADLIISVPKLKTHHWVGATLAMKNLFGLVPGGVYGWPKNVLHWAGIPECILDINRVFNNTFAVVDGIVGMEGNGPIQGSSKRAGVLVAGASLPAVDATCCRIMGIDPNKVPYLLMPAVARQIDTPLEAAVTPFELIPEFRYMQI